MSNITYGLSGEKFYIRPVDYDGIFDRNSRARYKVDLLKDTSVEVSSLEKAFCQVYQKTRANVINKDVNRELLKRRRPGIASKPPFYIATMCIIGSLHYILNNKEDPLRISRIVDAVVDRNADWNEAVDYFNSFFERDKCDDYSRIAVLYPGGKMALSFLLLGLQIVCDLIKEVVVFEQAGRFVESAQISNILGELGVDNMDVYQLMNSPEHPERKELLRAIDEHQSKHKLCFNSKGEWLIVNHLEIPKLKENKETFIPSKSQTELNTPNNSDVDSKVRYEAPKKYIKDSPEPEGFIKENKKGDEKSASKKSNSSGLNIPNEPEFGLNTDDDINGMEPIDPDADMLGDKEPQEPSEIDYASEEEGSTHNPDDKGSEIYSAKRRKKTISTSKESSTSGVSLFKAPKNRNAIPINIDDI